MRAPKPSWLRKKISDTPQTRRLAAMFERMALHTVCREANCPNRFECYEKKTATFMILGGICSRRCAFCNVAKGAPQPPDPAEPESVALAVRELGLSHAVITSVTRDDLADGGASRFAETVNRVRMHNPGITVELLVPDFGGNREALQQVIAARPEIINHNVETVPRLYPVIRPGADFARSLTLLESVKTENPSILTKSGIMVGLGETEEELHTVLRALRRAGCDMLTIGQYLSPSKTHFPVREYVHPERFAAFERQAREMGFQSVASGPFVRSSYQAGKSYKEIAI